MAEIHLQFTFSITWVDNWASAFSYARYMAGVVAFHLENSMQTAGPPHAHSHRINRANIVLCISGILLGLMASLTAGNPSIPRGINSLFINRSSHPNHRKSHQRRHPSRQQSPQIEQLLLLLSSTSRPLSQCWNAPPDRWLDSFLYSWEIS